MRDPRYEKLAEVLVNYSVEVEKGDLIAVQPFDLRGRKGFELDIGCAGILQAHDHAFQHPARAAINRRDHAAARRGVADVRIALVLPKRLAEAHGIADLDFQAGSQSDVIRAAQRDVSNRRPAVHDLFRLTRDGNVKALANTNRSDHRGALTQAADGARRGSPST